VADRRDRTAAVRDRTAHARDTAAVARDVAAVAREPDAPETGDLDDVIVTLKTLRLSSAARRQHSELERLAAASDREAAAVDRKQAASERRHAGLDELTGVFRRGMGEVALTHEIERSRRSNGSLVLAMIDVDALKAVNDQQGHAAGDALLGDVGAAITLTLRSYDVTVRWGGDEFVCTLSNATLDVVSERVAGIQRTLEVSRPGASVSVGLTELRDDDTLETLISRADSALYEAKAKRHT
jgi:diguanylate cyclase (GGDEF)-like protein